MGQILGDHRLGLVIAADMRINEMIVSTNYCVDRQGDTLYHDDDTTRSLLVENEPISAAAVQQILQTVDLRALGRKINIVLVLMPRMSVAATSD